MQNQNTYFLNPQNIIAQLGVVPGMHIADLGCGTGYMSFAAARAVGEKGIVHAVDVQKSVLDQVRREAQLEHLDNIQIVWSDIETPGALNIGSASIDVVFLVNVLFLISNRKAAIGEAVRIVKPGGKILIIDWIAGDMSIGPAAAARVGVAEVEQIMQEYSLTKIGEVSAGQYHFGLLYQKP